VTADSVDDLSSLAHQKITSPNTIPAARFCSLFTPMNRIAGRWAASQMASASAMSFFCRSTNGLKQARDQPNGMSEPSDLPRPIITAGAGLHRNRTSGLHGEEREYLLSAEFLRKTIAPGASAPCAWNTFFAKSNPIVLVSDMDASLE
jgi:hypothetical protein